MISTGTRVGIATSPFIVNRLAPRSRDSHTEFLLPPTERALFSISSQGEVGSSV